MTFRSKILLALAAVGLLPVGVLGGFSYRANRDELLSAAGGAQQRSASEAASSAEKFVLHGVESLRLSVTYIPFGQLTGQELAEVIDIPFRQLSSTQVVVLLDEAGEAVAGPRYAQVAEPGREASTVEDLDLFAQKIPLDAALKAGIAVGPPYRRSPTSTPRVAIAARVPGAARVLAAELSLAELEQRMAEASREGNESLLLDAAHHPVAQAAAGGGWTEAELARLPSSQGAGRALVRRDSGADWLVATAPLKSLGWVWVVAQPASAAFRSADRIGRYTLFWAGTAVLLIGVLGVVLARGLSRPIGLLSEAAGAIAQGAYDKTVPVESRDELGRFAQAFNQMASEVRRRDTEIRGWNADLQRKVDAGTAELRAAQDQIERTRRLAAVSSMGAGVAHELNNPLQAITGLLTLLEDELTDPEQAALVRSVQEETTRVTRIVSALKGMTEKEARSGGRRFSLADPVRQALGVARADLDARGIEVQLDAPAIPEVEGDPLQLQEVVGHLIQNALAAMPAGGVLRFQLGEVPGGAVKLSVQDTGKGIPTAIRERIFDPFFTTKDGGGKVGLGLTRAHHIVQAHRGRIVVESTEGQGATFTLFLPVAGGGAHLG